MHTLLLGWHTVSLCRCSLSDCFLLEQRGSTALRPTTPPNMFQRRSSSLRRCCPRSHQTPPRKTRQVCHLHLWLTVAVHSDILRYYLWQKLIFVCVRVCVLTWVCVACRLPYKQYALVHQQRVQRELVSASGLLQPEHSAGGSRGRCRRHQHGCGSGCPGHGTGQNPQT